MMPGERSENRRLAAIMFTDMVGYSALAQKNEAKALEILEIQRHLVRPVFARNQGIEVKCTGDGFLIEFASALAAVQCGIDIQEIIKTRNRCAPALLQFQIRIGIHLGDIVSAENDVFGDGVNIAARLEPLAEPGGLCISQQVFDQIHNKIEHPFVRFGVGELKNIQVPVVVYKLGFSPSQNSRRNIVLRRCSRRTLAKTLLIVLFVVGLALFWQHGTKAQSIRGHSSLAVLPFANLSFEKEMDTFSDGLTEELIAGLVKLGRWQVPSRTSSYAFKGKNDDIQKIGEQLRVSSVLEGTIRKSGSQLRITAQLVNVADGYHIWSETYNKEAGDFFRLQAEISQEVIEAIAGQRISGDAWGGVGSMH
jgi:adenylate cyclase